MLLERDLIQSIGFRNVREGGAITGFQLRVRMPSYRGMAASLIDGIAVASAISSTSAPTCRCGPAGQDLHAAGAVGQRRRALAARRGRHRHGSLPGGLPDGVHEVSVELRLRMSYIPIEHQPLDLHVTKHVTLTPEAERRPLQVRRLASTAS